MDSLIRRVGRQVAIRREGRFTMIGEQVNPTGRASLAAAMSKEDIKGILNLVDSQIQADADVLSVNVGMAGVDETSALPKVAELLASWFDVPPCLGSADPIEADSDGPSDRHGAQAGQVQNAVHQRLSQARQSGNSLIDGQAWVPQYWRSWDLARALVPIH